MGQGRQAGRTDTGAAAMGVTVATQPFRPMPGLFTLLLCRFRQEESRALFSIPSLPFHWLSFFFFKTVTESLKTFLLAEPADTSQPLSLS